jgi:hypothetical protein
MMKKIYFLLFLVPFLACKKFIGDNKPNSEFKTFKYSEMKMPKFFESLVMNHYATFKSVDSSDYNTLFLENNLQTDSTNTKKFYTLKILHKLFTSKNASNGSKGEILNIPYFWHWVNPNPRYDIVSLKTNQKLNTIPSPKEFSKYKSYADIDRTPYLFLSELLSEKPLYHSDKIGDFSSFGWCSEREMAFVCLLNTLNYKGKVITNNNHSWSEFIIPMKTKTNQIQNFKVRIDNTFDEIEWKILSNKEITTWENQDFKGQGNWYNKKALSDIEKQKVINHLVAIQSMEHIDEKVVDYLKDF